MVPSAFEHCEVDDLIALIGGSFSRAGSGGLGDTRADEASGRSMVVWDFRSAEGGEHGTRTGGKDGRGAK